MATDQTHAQVDQNRMATSAPRRPWHILTRDEQRALLLVLGLFVLGIGARAWFAFQDTHTHQPAANTQHTKEIRHAP